MKFPPVVDPVAPTTRPRHWLWPTRRRVLVGLVVAMGIWGWFDVRNRAAIDPGNPYVHKTDFTVYTIAGAAFFDGRDPYAVVNPRGWGYLYPPPFALLLAPLDRFDPRTQALVWFAISCVMAWGCYRESVRLATVVLPDVRERGIFGPIPTWIGVAAVAAAVLPALNCLQRGQVGIAKLYLLLLGFRLLVESRTLARSLVAGVVLAMAIVLKVTPLLPVGLALFQALVAAWYDTRRPGALPRAAAASVGTVAGLALWLLVIPACVIGWNANLHHLHTWYTTVAGRSESAMSIDFAGDSTSVRNQSFANAAHCFGNWASHVFAGGPDDQGPERLRMGGHGLVMDSPGVEPALLATRLLAGFLVLAVGFRLARAQDILGQTVGFSLAGILTLIAAPIARAHYYLLFLPAVMFLGVWLLRARRPRAAVFFVILPAVLVIAHYALLRTVGRVGLLGLGMTFWYAAACVVLLARARRRGSQDESQSCPSPAPAAERPLAA